MFARLLDGLLRTRKSSETRGSIDYGAAFHRPGPEWIEPPPLPDVAEARRERRLATGFAAVGVSVFLVALILDPYDDFGHPLSHGTHRQLGLPACPLKSLTSVGCPSCGMTTTFALLAHGDPVAAWNTNWAGFAIAVLAVLSTLWFLAVSAGLPPCGFKVDEIVKFAACAGVALAMARWLAALGSAACAAIF